MTNKTSNILLSICVAFSTYAILTTLGPTVDHELVQIWNALSDDGGSNEAK